MTEDELQATIAEYGYDADGLAHVLIVEVRAITTDLVVARGTATAETHRAERAEARVEALEREALEMARELVEAKALVDCATNIEHDTGDGNVWMFARAEGAWDVGKDGAVHGCDLSTSEAVTMFCALSKGET